MASTAGSVDRTTERCQHCDRNTPHAVSLETGGDGGDGHPTEPRRVTECLRCGHRDAQRISAV